MKRILIAFVAFISLSLTGCLDIIEEIDLTANGSGTYKTTADMSGAFDMLEMIAAMDTSANSGLKKLKDKNFDSSFQLKSLTDTASNLTPEQKKFFSRAVGRMQMNAEQKKFIINMDFPFDKPEDINTLTRMTEGGKGLSLLGKSAGGPAMNGSSDETMPSFDVFDWKFTRNLMERKVNPEKLAAFKSNNKFKDLGDAAGMLEQMKMKTVIHLPAAAKKVTGEKAVLSDDKKTVTISASVADIVKDPALLAYHIEY